MGYPMTWQRLINRNLLTDGDYNKPPQFWKCGVSLRVEDDGQMSIGEARRIALQKYERGVMNLAGDLRRLERDARDEGLIVSYIIGRTGISGDDVAAVLKEFFSL